MSEATAAGLYSTTAKVVMAFPSVVEARAFKRAGKEKGEAKFGGTFVFDADSEDLKAQKALVTKLAREKWPGRDLGADLKSGEFKWPFQSGDKQIEKRKTKLKNAGKEYTGDADFMAGKVILKASSKYQPGFAIIQNGKVVDLEGATITANKGKFYFGVEVLAQFNFVPYDAVGDDGKDGVTAYLQKVLSLNTGKKLSSGGQSAAEVFKGYVGHSTTEDPTAGNAGMDDEIPF